MKGLDNEVLPTARMWALAISSCCWVMYPPGGSEISLAPLWLHMQVGFWWPQASLQDIYKALNHFGPIFHVNCQCCNSFVFQLPLLMSSLAPDVAEGDAVGTYLPGCLLQIIAIKDSHLLCLQGNRGAHRVDRTTWFPYDLAQWLIQYPEFL